LQSSEIISVEFDKDVKINELNKVKGVEHVQAIHSRLFDITGSETSDIRKTLFNWAVQNDVQILSMNKKDSNLEHIFHQLTKEEK